MLGISFFIFMFSHNIKGIMIGIICYHYFHVIMSFKLQDFIFQLFQLFQKGDCTRDIYQEMNLTKNSLIFNNGSVIILPIRIKILPYIVDLWVNSTMYNTPLNFCYIEVFYMVTINYLMANLK